MNGTTALLPARIGGWHWRVAALFGISAPLFIWVAGLPALPQPLEYHDFADQRPFLGLPHFWNVASNLPFAVIGLIGWLWLLRQGRGTSAAFVDPGDRAAYFVFYAGGFLTCFGSSYYHAAPANATLVWDRLAYSLLLTSAFTIVITEFVSRRGGRLMLAPMVALGLLSVVSWAWTEAMGQGDLRLYALVQFYPVLALPLILLLFRSRYTHAGAFWVLWGLFQLAKTAEHYDVPVFEWTGAWSGHTVKHLVAAVATCVPLYMLQRRGPRAGDPLATQGAA